MGNTSTKPERIGTIRANWKFIIQNINPLPLLDELDKQHILNKTDFKNIMSQSRSHQTYLILVSACKKVQQRTDLLTLEHILGKVSSPCAKVISKPIEEKMPQKIDDQSKVESQTSRLKRHRTELENKLHRTDLLAILDYFIEAFIFSLDDVDNIIMEYPKRDATKCFVEKIVTKVNLGSVECLENSLKEQGILSRFEHIFSDVPYINREEKTEDVRQLPRERPSGYVDISDSTKTMGNSEKKFNTEFQCLLIETGHPYEAIHSFLMSIPQDKEAQFILQWLCTCIAGSKYDNLELWIFVDRLHKSLKFVSGKGSNLVMIEIVGVHMQVIVDKNTSNFTERNSEKKFQTKFKCLLIKKAQPPDEAIHSFLSSIYQDKDKDAESILQILRHDIYRIAGSNCDNMELWIFIDSLKKSLKFVSGDGSNVIIINIEGDKMQIKCDKTISTFNKAM